MIKKLSGQIVLLLLLIGMITPSAAMDSDQSPEHSSSLLNFKTGATLAAGAGLAYYVYTKCQAPQTKSVALSDDLPVIGHNPPQWDWSQIDTHQVSFPHDFGWGTATSAFQIEGHQTAGSKKIKNCWTESKRAQDANLVAECATGHWDKYKEDVQLIKQAGLKEYRFSIKWSAVEPEKGIFDVEAMQHYVDLVDELKANDIKPFVMLFHHSWPAWFGDIGDFQKTENNTEFIKFAEYVFEHLHGKVDMWMTFNEPAGFCLSAYYMADYPPYAKDLTTTGTALKNMIDTHAELYHRFKKKNKDCKVGLAKMFVQLDPAPNSNPLKRALSLLICSQFGNMQNNVVLDYLHTGKFNWGFPFYGRVTGENEKVKNTMDFIGVNYYANVMIDGTSRTTVPDRSVSDAGKALYPEGLLRAIELCAERLPKVPMWIGENGISDAKDTLREEYFKKHLWVVSYALKQGYEIKGYHVWTLLDSFNWKSGFADKYGLYEVDFESEEKTRTLRKGAQCIIELATTGRYA